MLFCFLRRDIFLYSLFIQLLGFKEGTSCRMAWHSGTGVDPTEGQQTLRREIYCFSWRDSEAEGSGASCLLQARDGPARTEISQKETSGLQFPVWWWLWPQLLLRKQDHEFCLHCQVKKPPHPSESYFTFGAVINCRQGRCRTFVHPFCFRPCALFRMTGCNH